MYISELELQGFKSFAYKTNVSFDKGITAIVGPNGCGKSNIVDAMRWVLGEQRPTLLRSSSMSNVIFNGTAKKNALGMAEVYLTFINNKGLLPTEYNEVTIGRRLYRSGESEYLINGTTCRLKDITDLFMDTGMSSDAYSVIELKMVEEILNDKNNDRRRLFEEAAGVTRYKEKRKKTFRKLDETQADLQRVEDILVEVRKKTNSLEKQAEKAQKAKKYKKELEHLDKALNKHEYSKIKEELEPLEERIDNADKEKKEIIAKAEKLEEEAEEARKALNEKEKQQSEAQRRVSQLNSKIRDTETTLEITQEKISNEENVIEQYTNDIEQSEKDLEDLREAFESSKKKLATFDDDLEKAETNLTESKERYSEIQQQYNKEQEELNQLEKDFSQANQDLNDLQTKRIKIESRLENTEGDLVRIREEIEDLEDEITNFRGEKKLAKEKLEQAIKARDQQQEKLQSAREQREDLSEKKNTLKDQIRSHQSKLDSVQSEIELLQDIANSNEAFPSSVQFLLENYGGQFNQLDVVSNLLSTDEKHAVALEAVLADALNYVVVDTLDDARKAATLLKENDKGRATFIPLDQLSDSYQTVSDSLANQVKTESKFSALKELLLGNVRVFDSVENAYSSLKDNGQTGVTLDGEVITNTQFLKSGSKSKNAGIRVGLKDKIDKLEDKAGSISSKIQSSEEELEEVQQQYEAIDLNELEQELKEKEQQVRKIENNINSFEHKIEIYQKNIGELENRRESLIDNEDSSQQQLDDLQPKQKALQQKLKDLHEQQEEKKETLQELDEERSIAQSRYNDAQLKHQDLKNKVENHERDIKRAQEGIKNLKKRLKIRSEKTEEAKERITKYRSTIDQLEDELSTLKEKKQEADKQLEQAEEASGKQRGRINEIEKDLKEVRRRKEVNMELVHHLAMSKEKYEMQIENLSDHIWETYGVLMDQIDKELPEDTEPDEAKERISWLRQRLNKIGEVNPLAIEEYEEEKERLDFYEEQVGDLHQAAEELQETINEINKTAVERFNKTFEKIRVNFQKVFHTLFNEDDYCDLVIDEEAEDPLDASIEIKANPKGKRPSTINQLSGGEKTLTAIALLFAIYLVKPSPFCVLDEVDAPLDDANIERFADMIRNFSEETQFIIITHNKKTMSKAEMMYGVTMPETGISRLVGVKLDEVAEV
ncbi:chromosome segregation protein SMC [Aliifodinibius salipaludis]|uniref:Chromosome partition protein Smc n=1 Tax=Fodinibius salipaludis TaxID=2032627 RepID=A0A2A2GB43_9BACT|nr:chromosome segregation protein SMC [Aliifodinibius salipaludis]PAU94083.1 chromosome segregation protein SMC [Aliifodinibius salipaludis]